MKTCPMCQTNDEGSHFCKKCGYKFFGSSLNHLKYVPPLRNHQKISRALYHFEEIGNKQYLKIKIGDPTQFGKF